MAKSDPVVRSAPTADDMVALGRALASLVRAGDLVMLTGPLGAGKTTLTQGIGAGLGVRGAVTSPTFVLARVHPAEGEGPDLVHVDAYRIGTALELDDLDLDTSVDEAVTVVEWGEGKAEGLASSRLEVSIDGGEGDDAGSEPDSSRRITVRSVGPRWAGVDLAAALQG